MTLSNWIIKGLIAAYVMWAWGISWRAVVAVVALVCMVFIGAALHGSAGFVFAFISPFLVAAIVTMAWRQRLTDF